MADLLALSARFIDDDVYEGPTSVNRVTTELSEVADGIGFIEAFSNVVAFATGDGLALFDTSLDMFGQAIKGSLRRWSNERIADICYTHGHIDHVGGASLFMAEAEERSDPTPRVVGHEAVPARFDRYRLTDGYNQVINKRQFATLGGGVLGATLHGSFGPEVWIAPSQTFAHHLDIERGELVFELHHARGETDDHLWAWVPKHRAVVVGDLVAWVFPNAGNPQKVQRYALEWAAALRAMSVLEPELLLPAHGLPVAGKERVARVLGDIATVLESLVQQTLERMNAGATLDTCIHEVKPPAALMQRPYLRPVYDEPEFVVRNIWRQYGGWYDGNPAHLKPPREADLARALAELSGGASAIAKRAEESEDLRLACQLIELASQAAPDDAAIHAQRAAIYDRRRESELSLMAKGIFATAAADSNARAKKP